jgi:hypothetical protein
VSLVLFVRIVPGMQFLICRPNDSESTVMWLLTDLLSIIEENIFGYTRETKNGATVGIN